MTQASPDMNADLEVKSLSPPKSSKPPKLREVRFDDYSQVAALALKSGLDADDFSAWKNLWMNNPTFREFKVKFPMGWVLETADGGIAGFLGNIPMRYELEGRRILHCNKKAGTARPWLCVSVLNLPRRCTLAS
jgi:hypothetical protein